MLISQRRIADGLKWEAQAQLNGETADNSFVGGRNSISRTNNSSVGHERLMHNGDNSFA